MIRDEQEVRDYLEAMENIYAIAGFAGHELAKTDPRINTLRWVLKRDHTDSMIEEIISEWRTSENQSFGSTSTPKLKQQQQQESETTSKLSTLLQQQAATTG